MLEAFFFFFVLFDLSLPRHRLVRIVAAPCCAIVGRGLFAPLSFSSLSSSFLSFHFVSLSLRLSPPLVCYHPLVLVDSPLTPFDLLEARRVFTFAHIAAVLSMSCFCYTTRKTSKPPLTLYNSLNTDIYDAFSMKYFRFFSLSYFFNILYIILFSFRIKCISSLLNKNQMASR